MNPLYNWRMPVTVLFFDLDDTLYPPNSGLWPAIQERMTLYMSERLRLPPEEVKTLRRRYFEAYGTTLRGLQLHHQVDAGDFLTYVHDLPIEQYLHPAPLLRDLLLDMSLPRWIFTNASAGHARRVLEVLGLSDCFRGIIDIFALDFACKPEIEAYQRALRVAGENSPQNAVLFDDSLRNLSPARRLGFTTVLVGPNGQPDPAVDYSLPDLLSLPRILPQFGRMER
ncbi:MAG: putative pyrimidine 5-nucleotidase [Chloroflexi bacterium]|nr:putative pyrimidine 5-nucleotidase [Chloroflexota bacterium]